jgi:hypothetical protein
MRRRIAAFGLVDADVEGLVAAEFGGAVLLPLPLPDFELEFEFDSEEAEADGVNGGKERLVGVEAAAQNDWTSTSAAGTSEGQAVRQATKGAVQFFGLVGRDKGEAATHLGQKQSTAVSLTYPSTPTAASARREQGKKQEARQLPV